MQDFVEAFCFRSKWGKVFDNEKYIKMVMPLLSGAALLKRDVEALIKSEILQEVFLCMMS